MSRRLVSAIVCVLVLCFSLSSFAGSVHLTNGDRVTGKIVKMAGGKLVVESEMLGTIEIPVGNIKTLDSDEVLDMHFNNGTVLKQSVDMSSTTGRVKIVGDGTVDSQEIAIADLKLINPPLPEPPHWKGDVSVGVTRTTGNTNNDTLAFSAGISKETDKDRITFGADLFKKEVEAPNSTDKLTTEDWWKLRGKYDYFYSKKMYVFGEGRYEQDKVALLDKRVIVGGGLGYQWIKSDAQNFSVEAGLSDVFEDYNDGTQGTSKFSVTTGYHYDLKFNKVFSFIHDTSFFPNTEDTSDYYLTISAELRTKLNTRMFTNFKVLYDYDTTPALNRKRTDVKYIFGIGVNF
jgi:putative salt-induced outer membrane protein YdiY